MNSKAIASIALGMSLIAAGSVFAQRAPLDPNVTHILGQDPNLPVQEQARRSNREERLRQLDAQGFDTRGFGRQHDHWRSRGRGVGPNHEYYRGDRLPYEYRHRNYVVNDWRSHRLSAPPRGYHWVQSGNDYILIAIATGVIAQILLSN